MTHKNCFTFYLLTENIWKQQARTPHIHPPITIQNFRLSNSSNKVWVGTICAQCTSADFSEIHKYHESCYAMLCSDSTLSLCPAHRLSFQIVMINFCYRMQKHFRFDRLRCKWNYFMIVECQLQMQIEKKNRPQNPNRKVSISNCFKLYLRQYYPNIVWVRVLVQNG